MGTLSSRQIEPTLRQLSDKVDKLENGPLGTIVRHDAVTETIPNNSWTTTESSLTLEKGTWIIFGHVSYVSNATGVRGIRLYHGFDGELAYTRVTSNAATGSGNTTRLQCSYPISFSRNTTITIQTYQNSGSGLSATSYLRAIRIK